jgi:hypothetical protein
MDPRPRPALDHPANIPVLAYLATRAAGKQAQPEVRWPHEVEQPYLSLGCHPDVVERIWQTLNDALPADCRAVVHHTPVLLHPTTGAIIASGIGTGYALWLPAPLIATAAERGLSPVHVFGLGRALDLRTLGDGWLFGKWLREEPAWCLAAFEAVG